MEGLICSHGRARSICAECAPAADAAHKAITGYPHPLDDPSFDPHYREHVWYLAHPLAPDAKFSFQDNMDHALRMMVMCFEEGFRVIAPWHTMVLAYGGIEPPRQRVVAMETDLRVAYGLGRIILCGHKISRGMAAERDAVHERVYDWNKQYPSSYLLKWSDVIIDLTGRNEDNAREILRRTKASLA